MSDINIYADQTAIDALTPITGDVVLRADDNAVLLYNGSAWKEFQPDAGPFTNDYSLSFDGTDDYMTVTTTSSMPLYGFSAWVYLESTLSAAGIQGIVFGNSGTQWIMGLGGNFTSTLTDEIISINLGARYGYSSSSDTVAAGWHHMAAVWSTSSTTNSGSNGYDIYLDGVNVGNQANITYGAATLYTLPASSVRFGQRGDGTFSFGGKLDELALFNSPLSASDVASLRDTSGPNPVPADISSLNPAHWWRMGDGDDVGDGSGNPDGTLVGGNPQVYNMATDSSGNRITGNDGTLINGPTFSSDVPS